MVPGASPGSLPGVRLGAPGAPWAPSSGQVVRGRLGRGIARLLRFTPLTRLPSPNRQPTGCAPTRQSRPRVRLAFRGPRRGCRWASGGSSVRFVPGRVRISGLVGWVGREKKRHPGAILGAQDGVSLGTGADPLMLSKFLCGQGMIERSRNREGREDADSLGAAPDRLERASIVRGRRADRNGRGSLSPADQAVREVEQALGIRPERGFSQASEHGVTVYQQTRLLERLPHQ